LLFGSDGLYIYIGQFIGHGVVSDHTDANTHNKSAHFADESFQPITWLWYWQHPR